MNSLTEVAEATQIVPLQSLLSYYRGEKDLLPEDLTERSEISKQAAEFLLGKIRRKGKMWYCPS